ncbi:MAG: fructose-1,6-bisphosphatase [Negativibacillus massiliensis]|uniref:fructose-1,6-bisphosphatase n=1 Tax=Negativibacillus massiliensis TaxID=1871035 RepID=UPI0023F4072A|nr:fructose-1,6-bisphosphatase [Negativibacillus massiliensis]MCI6348565.1 fructose-1,6-bisphosphatase [Negativibacillus massiliensis]MDY4047205.1 fructose-1,6-bisphosphatase [Negativibacillus massiliensis]
MNITDDRIKFLRLLSEKYRSRQQVCTEIINLQAILNLPKGTEHFMSDLHGEYEAFSHILNNSAGVIREKVDMLFEETLTPRERSSLCTLIYYPEEKLEKINEEGRNTEEWYRFVLQNLIDLAKMLSSKYTRSKVRKAMPSEYSYILDELLHAQADEDNNQFVYHQKIIDTLLKLGEGDDFIIALSSLIKRLAVDHLHIVGDIFDRGERPDAILNMLMQHHSLDIEWGNHDILWMGAACGSQACIAAVVRNCLSYNNISVLEQGYGISLRPLVLFAEKMYDETDPNKAAKKAISIILFKLEGQIIRRNPDYGMQERLLLDKVNFDDATIEIDGVVHELKEKRFPTINRMDPYALDPAEREIMDELEKLFRESEQLQRHVTFLYNHGSMYRKFNGNLLFHGCVPLDEDGNLKALHFGGRIYQGKSYMDYADSIARRAYFSDDRTQKELDFMWYLWCGSNSPLSGRVVKTFERTFLSDESTWKEPKNPYYRYQDSEPVCRMLLREFGLYSENSHIINGHTPIHVMEGENPLKANGRLIVIDGGFCKAYQKTTGIAGYTLIFNSHGMRLKSHQPFSGMEAALSENLDIDSQSQQVATLDKRLMVADTDTGEMLKEQIADLEDLLTAYREGLIAAKA